MRLHSVTPYSQRLPSKNRRTDGSEGISTLDTLNRFFSGNSHAYTDGDENEDVLSVRPLHTKYPVKVLYYKARPCGHFSSFSVVYFIVGRPLLLFLSIFSFLVVVFV